MARIDDIERLIVNHQRRLQKLKEQQAIQGISTPPSIMLHIEDLESEIERLRSELEQLDKKQAKTSSVQASEIRQLIDIKERRLRKLEERKALQGLNTDVQTIIEIEDLRSEIDHLRADYRQLDARQLTSPVQEKPFISNLINWTRIAAFLVAVGAVCITVFTFTSDLRSFIFPSITPTPISSSEFIYQVRVEAIDTGKSISKAEVTLETSGVLPLREITDSNGIVRVFIASSFANQPARLTIQAEGYRSYTRFVDLIEGALPIVIQLEPSSTLNSTITMTPIAFPSTHTPTSTPRSTNTSTTTPTRT